MKILFNIVFIVFLFPHARATNYYLSSKGDDSKSGMSVLTPWRTLKKLSMVMELIRPGDSILFERGCVFQGTLRISSSGKLNNEIYFGAYGSGAKPIVGGLIEISGWTPFRGNIWVTDCVECATDPGNLFIDRSCQPLGRYPNEGYLTLSCTSQCKRTFTDNTLSFADGYWDGAEVVVKSSRWTLDNLQVHNYFNKTFYFSDEASYPLPNGYGYFIQKHLVTLDKPGEWFFDKTLKKIFLYCAIGDKPGNHSIEVSVTDIGVDMMNVSFVTIENIAFKYQRLVGAQIKQCNNFLMRNCVVDYSGNKGMEVSSCQNPRVENCQINNSNNNGVEWSNNAAGTFIRNAIKRTGLHPGRGESGNGTYIALHVTSSNSLSSKNLFQYNTIDSTGYIGIDFRTGGTFIRNNLVSNFCMIKDDGAGIYTWGNSLGSNMIDGNIVLHGIGSSAGTKDTNHLSVSGIYIDDRSESIEVKNNTVSFCGSNGIFVHNAKHLLISGNTLFANGSNLINREASQLCIKLDALVTMENRALDLRVSENLFVTTQRGPRCVYLAAEKEQDLAALGLLERNQYFAPQANHAVARFCERQEFCNAIEEFTLSEWQRSGNDKNSSFKSISGLIETSSGMNQIRNSSMTNNIDGWVIWPSQVSIVQDRRTGADGPSLQVQFPPEGSEALLYYAGIRLSSNKLYRLSFSARGRIKSKIEFTPLMATAPWESLDVSTCFSIDTVFNSFTYFFQPNKSNIQARVNFKSNSTFWIDNVTLYEVESRKEPTSLQLIYNAAANQNIFSLSEKMTDLDGRSVSNSVIVPGYGSLILQKH